DLEIAVEQRILDFFPADAEHRCRCVNTGYHTRRKALGYAAGKAACACRDFKNGFASAEFEKISQLLGQLHPEVRLGGHPIIFARMVVIMKSGGMLLVHHRPILRETSTLVNPRLPPSGFRCAARGLRVPRP